MKRDINIALFFAILLFALFIFLLSSFKPETAEEHPAPQPGCREGATEKCMIGNCSGMRACSSGEWGSCRLEQICAPGSVAPCIENYCVSSYKTCNDCGTGYGPCMPRNQT